MPESKDIVIVELQINEGAGGKKAPEAKKEVEALAGSIVGLSQANKALRLERGKLDTTTDEGRKKINELNVTINKNNDAIKANSSALEKQRLNVGNYTGALDTLVPGLGATANGFGAATKAAWAFIATPIGAIIGALGLAIGALTKYFTSSEEGQNKFAKISRVVSIVLDNLSDKVSALGKFLIEAFEDPGKALEDFGNLIKEFIIDRINETIEGIGLVRTSIILLFQGEFSKAADAASEGLKKIVRNATPIGIVMDGAAKAVQGFTDILKESNDEIQKGMSLEDLKAQTDLLERALIVQGEVLKAKIAELKLRGEDKSLDLQERSAALKEAMKLQDDLSQMEIQVARNRFEIKKTENSFANSTKEELNEQAQLEAELFRIQKDNSDKKKEIFIKEQAFQSELRKQDLAAYQAHLDEQHRLYLEAKAKRDEADEIEAERYKNFNDRLAKETVDRINKQTKAEASALAFQKNVTYARIGFAETLANTLGQLAGKNKLIAIAAILIEKVAAIAGIVSSTALANLKAIAVSPLTFGQPWVGINTVTGIAAGVGVAASAANSISQIGGFARGGKVGTFLGPSHSGGGIDYIRSDGKHRINVEGNENFYVLKKSASAEINRLSAINQKHGGRSWGGQPSWYAAQGGQIETRQISNSRGMDNRLLNIERLLATMPRPVVLVADIVTGTNNVVEVQQRSAPI